MNVDDYITGDLTRLTRGLRFSPLSTEALLREIVPLIVERKAWDDTFYVHQLTIDLHRAQRPTCVWGPQAAGRRWDCPECDWTYQLPPDDGEEEATA